MNKLEFLVSGLPSPDSARRFFEQFSERNPSHALKLQKNEGLFSDVLALASFSPLLAATMIQSPDHVAWLGKERMNSTVRSKNELMESLARFTLTHSQLEPHVLFARFRRRELLRIFLRDIRRLGTIAEITEEISNLADAILENALRIARQEMDNRYGPPFEIDDKGKKNPSNICIVSLGKLGSKELNYSSDIDLMFIYSADGQTSVNSLRGSVTNREYFIKTAEYTTQLIGRQSGEGAAYRVDLRLRPHGRVGALALSLAETVKYYLKDARSWERQVLIRSRSSAGAANIYKDFFSRVEDVVFEPGRDPETALREVLRSKQKIDENKSRSKFDVKLGRGGIREIEFISQALQLAYGGTDRWLRIPHSLISISRLADRQYLTDNERSSLSAAYDFLRRLEHILQMEQGLQTHTVPSDENSVLQIAGRMGFKDIAEFRSAIQENTDLVHSAFLRVFGHSDSNNFLGPTIGEVRVDSSDEAGIAGFDRLGGNASESIEKRNPHSLDKSNAGPNTIVDRVNEVSPYIAQMISSRPWLADGLEISNAGVCGSDYGRIFSAIVHPEASRPQLFSELRKQWSRALMEIAVADIFQAITPETARECQTRLAESCLRAGVQASAAEVRGRYDFNGFDPTIIALGKLGSGTLDYGSDLDLVITYSDPGNWGPSFGRPGIAEIYSRGIEYFVTLLSSMTRDGNLYRVDLRLRPHGKNGPIVTTELAFEEYIEKDASIWELLAYGQLREIKTGPASRGGVEASLRDVLTKRLGRENAETIRSEARTMRLRLEKKYGSFAGERDVDIKFGPGGLLDVYFIVRCLHLLHFDIVANELRSTRGRLVALSELGLISAENFESLLSGHAFLSELEHNIRLILGRSSRFPRANSKALQHIASRMNYDSVKDLTENLTVHRLNIRSAFDDIL